jgi:hypothetical protein
LPVASHGSMTPDTPLCLRCNTQDDSQCHWYQCQTDSVHQSRDIQDTTQFLHNSDLHPQHHSLVLMALYGRMGPHHYKVSQVFENQQVIGWDHFLRGRLTKSWTETQNKLQQSTQGTQTLCKIISYIFNIMHTKWIYRNNEIHGNDTTIKERYRDTILIPRVTHLYNHRHLLPTHDKQILDTPLDTFIQQDPITIERWLKTNEEYIKQSIKRESARIKTKNHNITKFFPVIRETTQIPRLPAQHLRNVNQPSVHTRNPTLLILHRNTNDQISPDTRDLHILSHPKHDLHPP